VKALGLIAAMAAVAAVGGAATLSADVPSDPPALHGNPNFAANVAGWSGKKASLAWEGGMARVHYSRGVSGPLPFGITDASQFGSPAVTSSLNRRISASARFCTSTGTAGKSAQIVLVRREAPNNRALETIEGPIQTMPSTLGDCVTATAKMDPPADDEIVFYAWIRNPSTTGTQRFHVDDVYLRYGLHPPEAGVAPITQEADVGETVEWTAHGTDPDSPGIPLTFEWDLDDDGQYDDATGATVSRSFAGEGSYSVEARVTDDEGEVMYAGGFVDVVAAP
jgi:PKD domain